MKKFNFSLSIVIFLISLNVYSQVVKDSEGYKTIFSSFSNREGEINIIMYGLVNVSTSTYYSSAIGMEIGGEGGVIINNKIGIGLFGDGFYTVKDKDLTFNKREVKSNIGGGYGGFKTEFFFDINKPVNFSVPLRLGIGGVLIDTTYNKTTINNNTYSSRKLESSALFIVDPGININFNITRFFVITLQARYRFAFVQNEKNYLNNSDLSNATFGLLFKFGNFNKSFTFNAK